ncbi:MAG: hypothetical protein H7839_23895, partial [Magnetococcus sp. YQC-5]
LEIIEWKSVSERVIHLCDLDGFPLSRHGERFHVGDFNFSAYLKSAFIGRLNEENVLELGGMNPALKKACDEARKTISTHFKNRAVERAQPIIAQWKADNVYPFEGDPVTPVETVEREVFEIVAVRVNDHLPDFSTLEKKTKAFQLRMLRNAIEKSPEELQLILTEVLNLSPKEQKELATLLQETTFSAIIKASKLVADRMKFLDALETILFDPEMKKHLKERSQLHKLLERNTWIFGEEFHLTASDKGLTEALRVHAEQQKRKICIDRPVVRINGKKGIIDLMLSRKLNRNRANELEYLVVELKAPKVSIGSCEITQIEEYAFAVANDDRFKGADTRWTFWVISNKMDDYARRKARQADRPEGVVHESEPGDNPRITVWVMEWARVIRDSRVRHKFFREALEHDVDKDTSLGFLRETYGGLLKDVIVEGAVVPTELGGFDTEQKNESQEHCLGDESGGGE